MSVSVCLSVTEVHWRIIANLGFKFRSHSTALCVLLAVLLAGGSSRAMLASAWSLVDVAKCEVVSTCSPKPAAILTVTQTLTYGYNFGDLSNFFQGIAKSLQ